MDVRLRNERGRKPRLIVWALCLGAVTAIQGGAAVAAVAPHTSSTTVAAATGHIVVFDETGIPAGFTDRVSAQGGSVLDVFAEVGLAVVDGLSDGAAADLASTPGVVAVERDLVLGPAPDDEPAAAALNAVRPQPLAAMMQLAPSAATYYSRQWNLRAIGADTAWAAGHLGSPEVSAFVLDTGIDYLHPDLVGRVDLARSISLVSSYSTEDAVVASTYPGRHPVTDLHSHGTAVAGLISSNATALAGVTQRTTLVGVKVHDRTRMAPISNYLEGILYAADHGADVMHLSVPLEFSRLANPGLAEAVERVIKYGYKQGAVMVAAAGNNATNLDADPDRFRFCSPRLVVCVSATGPTSAAGLDGPWVGVDEVAPYTSFGRATIEVAGPGGVGTPGQATTVWLVCSRAAIVTTAPQAACRAGGLVWSSVGTSFGAAATSGLAALLVSEIGRGKPKKVEKAIFQTARDLGVRGTDPYYGKGRIDVPAALASVQR